MNKVISTSIPEYVYDFCKKNNVKPRELILLGFVIYNLSLEKIQSDSNSSSKSDNSKNGR